MTPVKYRSTPLSCLAPLWISGEGIITRYLMKLRHPLFRFVLVLMLIEFSDELIGGVREAAWPNYSHRSRPFLCGNWPAPQPAGDPGGIYRASVRHFGRYRKETNYYPGRWDYLCTFLLPGCRKHRFPCSACCIYLILPSLGRFRQPFADSTDGSCPRQA